MKDFLELFFKLYWIYKVLVSIQQYVGTVKRTSSDNKIILLVNKADKGIVKQGSSLDIQIDPTLSIAGVFYFNLLLYNYLI